MNNVGTSVSSPEETEKAFPHLRGKKEQCINRKNKRSENEKLLCFSQKRR